MNTIPSIIFNDNAPKNYSSFFPNKRMIWYIMLKYCDLPEILNLSETCKQFQMISKDENIWKAKLKELHPQSLFFRTLEEDEDDPKSASNDLIFVGEWKKRYKRRVITLCGSNRPV